MGISMPGTLVLSVMTSLVLLAGPVGAQSKAQPTAAPDPSASSATPERAMITSGLDSEAVAQANPELAVWLDAGDSGRVLGLLEPELTATPKGALVLLNNEGLSADAGVIGALREPLAKAGWAALSLGLPMPVYALQKAWQMEAEPLPSTPTDTPPEDAALKANDSVMIDVMAKDLKALEDAYRTQQHQRLQAVIDELGRRGYSSVVLLGLGRGADVVAREIAANRPSVSALIWLAPTFRASREQPLTGLMKSVDQPVLELFSQREQANEASQRQALMNRAGHRQYQQQPVSMDLPPVRRDASQIAARITAWLDRP